MKKLGITTTIPYEIAFAAGYIPIDLNNIFITSPDYLKYIEVAENHGFPKSMCSWIKGIYGAALTNNIDTIVGVTEGDCSNTHSLTEIFKLNNIDVIDFKYPTSHRIDLITKSLNNFAEKLGTTIEKSEIIRNSLLSLREKIAKIDQLCNEEKISSFYSHLYQVSCSDFNGNWYSFEKEIDNFLITNNNNFPKKHKIRAAFIGVPPMYSSLYEYLESLGCIVVYNEIQREFAFPRAKYAKNIFEQYHDYSYPYSLDFRYNIIFKEIKLRNIDCIIHYTQSFCHKSIDNIYFNKKFDIPIINIEGDRSTEVDSRTKLRLESFIDMVISRKAEK